MGITPYIHWRKAKETNYSENILKLRKIFAQLLLPYNQRGASASCSSIITDVALYHIPCSQEILAICKNIYEAPFL